MQNVPIQALPSQTFSLPLDGNQWDCQLKTVNGAIAVSLSVNGVLVIENVRAVAGRVIIPAKYQENGNFVFITQSFQVPDYTQFGTSQHLIYISSTELSALRADPALPLTPADFDSNGALPLRLFPQGYAEAGPFYVVESAGQFYITEDGSSAYVIE